jgi:hypothetical protein
VGLVRQWDGLVVTGYGDLEHCFEDPEFGREQPVDGRRRDIRQVADGLDRGGGVAAFEEQGPGRLDDGGSGRAEASYRTVTRRLRALI